MIDDIRWATKRKHYSNAQTTMYYMANINMLDVISVTESFIIGKNGIGEIYKVRVFSLDEFNHVAKFDLIKGVSKCNIALDYDETYTAAPELFKCIVKMMQEHGHLVTFVTYRAPFFGNDDIEADANDLGIDIVYTSGRQKQHLFQADIWIDDSPEYIVSADLLGKMYNGCLVNNDMDQLEGVSK